MLCATCANALDDQEPVEVAGVPMKVTIKDDRGVHHSACWGKQAPQRPTWALIGVFEAAFVDELMEYCTACGIDFSRQQAERIAARARRRAVDMRPTELAKQER